ncbi:MAG: TIGR03790 family protein [Lacunisphaera sp.]|nr:TIGR03790 family protein [Lacunisphaera sp.]
MKAENKNQPGAHWSVWRRGLFFAFTLTLILTLRAEGPEARVVILANSRQAESVRLAEFYAEQRDIPAANIVALPLPEAESITWREFIDQVWQPVQDELHKRGWIEGTTSSQFDRLGRCRYAATGNSIAYLVTCRGVPLRIYNDPTLLEAAKADRKMAPELHKNESAVDAELSLIALGGYEITALVPNPLFANDRPPSLDAELVVKVARLDGPTWESARHLVTSALEAERTGLVGRYYVDLQGPHPDGDQWLQATRTQLEELGFDGDTEATGVTFDAAARFDAPVFYFGWYAGNLNGPFAREGFTFRPGAVALHIHSFSAPTMRSADSAWCGPLVARGVTATVGNVFEPYLGFTHRPNFLLRALSQGKNFGDAVYYALPVLSWQAVAIGDPLYRPFKVPLAEQGASPYAVIRRANLLLRQGNKAGALTLLKAEQRAHPSLPVGLAWAKLAVSEGQSADVSAALGFAAQLKEIRPADWPLLREMAGLLAAHAVRPAALQVYKNLARAKPPTTEALKALLAEARQTADAAGDLKQSLEFARQINELTPPVPGK